MGLDMSHEGLYFKVVSAFTVYSLYNKSDWMPSAIHLSCILCLLRLHAVSELFICDIDL